MIKVNNIPDWVVYLWAVLVSVGTTFNVVYALINRTRENQERERAKDAQIRNNSRLRAVEEEMREIIEMKGMVKSMRDEVAMITRALLEKE